jgi:hypothetical protein
MPRWSSMNKQIAHCHPERKHYCKGLCRPCYRKQPTQKAVADAYRKTPAQRKRIALYEQSRDKAVVHRRCRHKFDAADEARFQAITLCDWCHQPFDGDLPSVDHDHRCCPTVTQNKHCWKCTRGFVHHRCNTLAIAYYEWLEKRFGVIDEKLADYRSRFPVPRRPL